MKACSKCINHRRQLLARLVCSSLALFSGCYAPPSVTDPGATPPCNAKIEWGRRLGAAVVTFHDGDRAEVTLGFQGWRFINSAARLTSTNAEHASFAYDVDLEGVMPYHQGGGISALHPGPDGALYAENLPIFLNDLPLCQLVGRRATVRTTATLGSCVAQTQATVVLTHGMACFQNSDGTIDCSPADGGVICADGGT